MASSSSETGGDVPDCTSSSCTTTSIDISSSRLVLSCILSAASKWSFKQMHISNAVGVSLVLLTDKTLPLKENADSKLRWKLGRLANHGPWRIGLEIPFPFFSTKPKDQMTQIRRES
ncbi:hypothetical protein QVD17_24835 [Tagetes erecta]|uniref:Uncharacterized protein n=1 Tax=Tagetes erecta TaxID=13708 RepID=A0AAD8KKI7_TARER|nr:hypothetical protein QVD17_24835 [Tagetes erecta]